MTPSTETPTREGSRDGQGGCVICGGELPSILWIIFQIVGLAVSFAGVAVVASLLSDIYRGLFPADAPAERRAS